MVIVEATLAPTYVDACVASCAIQLDEEFLRECACRYLHAKLLQIARLEMCFNDLYETLS